VTIVDRRALVRVAALIATAALVFGLVLIPVRLEGISMLPTYESGAINFVNRLAYLRSAPSRGDVVGIRMAGLRVLYVKRIVGLPGERVEIVVGVVMINGEPLVEPTVALRAPWNLAAFTLGKDEYLVIGDNRSMAIENHDFGRVERRRILGRLLF
jgi:signal peptidase I